MYVNSLSVDDVESYIMNVKDVEVKEDVQPIINQERPLVYRTAEFIGLEYPLHHLYIFATDDRISYENEQKRRTITRSSWRTYIQSKYSLAEEKIAQKKLDEEAQQEIEF